MPMIAPTDVPFIDYDDHATIFEESLVTKMRGNTPDEAFLERWVPDSDPVEGILNMIDAVFESGRSSVAIQFSDAMVSAERVGDLERRVAEVGRATVERHEGRSILRVERKAGLDAEKGRNRRPRAETSAISRLVEGAPPLSTNDQYVERALAELQGKQAAKSEVVVLDLASAPGEVAVETLSRRAQEFGKLKRDGTKLVVSLDSAIAKFAAAPPAFREGLKDAFDSISHEGSLGPTGRGVSLEAAHDLIVLAIEVDVGEHRIISARHRGATEPVDRAVFEAYCRVIESLPIQDASDYSEFRLLHALRNRSKSRPVRGVMRSVNSGPVFARPVVLMRRLRQLYGERTGFTSYANGYDPAPSSAWVKLERDEMLSRLEGALRQFLGEHRLAHDAMAIRGLTKTTSGYFLRVFVGFGASVEWRVKPELMYAFERYLKDHIEGRLQVYHDEMKDRSQLRRL